MKFYQLTHPNYLSDQANRKYNPVKLLPVLNVPAIVCDNCGFWCSSERIRKKISLTSKVEEILGKKSIHINDWDKIIKTLSVEIGIQEDLLKPGTELGMPRGVIASVEVHDFIHPFPGQIWVKEDVVNTLLQNKAIGVEFCQVESDYRRAKSKNCIIKTELWEIVVTGKAWRKGSSFEKILACDECKRTIFPDPQWLKVDEAIWDGSDFFTLDLNPNIIIVTEKIFKLFSEKGYTNFQCKSI